MAEMSLMKKKHHIQNVLTKQLQLRKQWDAGDLRRHRAHYDVILVKDAFFVWLGYERFYVEIMWPIVRLC